MIYDVRQTTTYHYASPVAYARHVLRLTPIDRAGPARPRRRARHRAGAGRAPRRPGFLRQPHDLDRARPAARHADACGSRRASRSSTSGAPSRRTTPPWEEVRDAAFASRRPLAAVAGAFPVRRAGRSRSIRKSATMRPRAFAPGRPVLDGAIDLMQRIKADFVYEIGATTASTTPPMSFALRRGVCQDFAHIMISGLRGARPAGRLCQRLSAHRAARRARRGSKAPTPCTPGCWSGAATEAGWIGLDPTNGMLAGNDHVVLAIGRDYADVAPIDGVIFASGGQRLEVAVSVTPVG